MNCYSESPFDVGLQAERTALSWQRTALSSAVGFLLAARLFLEVVGSLSFLLAAVGLILTAALFYAGHQRYRNLHTILTIAHGNRVPLSSATPLFMWALVVFSLAIGGLVLAILVSTVG